MSSTLVGQLQEISYSHRQAALQVGGYVDAVVTEECGDKSQRYWGVNDLIAGEDRAGAVGCIVYLKAADEGGADEYETLRFFLRYQPAKAGEVASLRLEAEELILTCGSPTYTVPYSDFHGVEQLDGEAVEKALGLLEAASPGQEKCVPEGTAFYRLSYHLNIEAGTDLLHVQHFIDHVCAKICSDVCVDEYIEHPGSKPGEVAMMPLFSSDVNSFKKDLSENMRIYCLNRCLHMGLDLPESAPADGVYNTASLFASEAGAEALISEVSSLLAHL